MKKTDLYDDTILGMLPNHKPYTVKTDPWVTGLNTNQVVIGGAGSGKTTSVVEPNLLRMKNGNAVIVLTKSGRSDTIKYALRQNGYRIFEIAFDHPEKEDCYGYDPLAYCHNDADLRSLAHEIAHAGENEFCFDHDPYWRDSAESIIYNVLWYVAHGYCSRGKRLQDALYLLDRYSWGEPDNCGTLVLDLGFEDDGTDRAQEFKADYLRCKHRTPEEKERLKEYEDWLEKENARRDQQSRSFAERCRLQDERRLHGNTDIFDAEIEEEADEPEDDAKNRLTNEEYEQFKKEEHNAKEYEDTLKVRKRNPMHTAMRRLMKINPFLYYTWKNFTDLPDSTGACVTGTMKTALATVFTEDVRKILNNPRQLAFSELLKPKTVVFVHMSPTNVASYRFISFFYTQLFQALFDMAEQQEDYTLPHPVQVICDDFATGCPIPDFDAKISILREKRIGITMLLQSESQLAALYGDRKARTIINNCDTYLYFGGMDMNTVQSIAQRMNIPYDEVQAMPLGKEYIIRRGQKPIIAHRFSLFEDPLYKEILEKQKKRTNHPGSSPSDKEVSPCLF